MWTVSLSDQQFEFAMPHDWSELFQISTPLAWGDGSVSKVPVMQVWGSEFASSAPTEKPDKSHRVPLVLGRGPDSSP